MRAIKADTSYAPRSVYLILDNPPAEALNQAAAVKGEPLLLFLDAGLSPTHPDWLARMVAKLDRPAQSGGVGAVVGG